MKTLLGKRERERETQGQWQREVGNWFPVQHNRLRLDFCKVMIVDSGRALLPLQLSYDQLGATGLCPWLRG